MSRIELSIVIPAFDEEAAIASVVDENARAAAALSTQFEILVCDDGSRDGTGAILRGLASERPELRLLHHATNRGIPATMKELYAAARGEWTYFTPGDGQVPPEALGLMWAARAGVSAVVGRRFPRRDPFARGLIAYAYSRLLRVVFDVDLRDFDGVKLYRTDQLRTRAPRSTSVFFEAELLISLSRDGLGVREVDVPHRPRRGGRAKGVSLRLTRDALRDVAAFALEHRLGKAPAHDVGSGTNS